MQETAAPQRRPDASVEAENPDPQNSENRREAPSPSEITTPRQETIPEISAGIQPEEMPSKSVPTKSVASHQSVASEEVPLESNSTEQIKPTAYTPALSGYNHEKVSGLAITSIRKKKELLARQRGNQPVVVEENDEKFTETQLQAAWDEYIKRIKNKGAKILASIMESDMPQLNGKIISIELPNETMKNDMERGQNPLMAFLKKKLQNTLITLEINVNEQAAKKYAFTDIEKYNKLKEKNPLIEKLRTTFDLDI